MIFRLLTGLCLLIESITLCSGQRIILKGKIRAADSSLISMNIDSAAVEIRNSGGVLLNITVSDRSGNYIIGIGRDTFDTYCRDSILEVNVHSRQLRKTITLDSVCAYMVTKSPGRFLDHYERIRIQKESPSVIKKNFFLHSLLICKFGLGSICYENSNIKPVVNYGLHPDTVVICFAELFKSMLKKDSLLRILISYPREEKNDSIMDMRIELIRTYLNMECSIDKSKIMTDNKSRPLTVSIGNSRDKGRQEKECLLLSIFRDE